MHSLPEIKHPLLFVTGNSTAGKSTLAKLLAEKLGVSRASGDGMRVGLYRDSRYGPIARFYADQKCEAAYYAGTDPDERWENLREQSLALWPPLFFKLLCGYRIRPGPLVFEGVNLMPDLVAQDFPGTPIVAVVCEDEALVLRRLAEAPRWGNTPELQALEAREIAVEQAPRYRELTLAHGGQVFSSAEAALPYCLGVFGGAAA